MAPEQVSYTMYLHTIQRHFEFASFKLKPGGFSKLSSVSWPNNPNQISAIETPPQAVQQVIASLPVPYSLLVTSANLFLDQTT